VHIHFTELLDLDADSVLQDKWISEYRARWAARDAMLIPVVTADLDPTAIEDLITACVHYHRTRTQATARQDTTTPGQDDALAMLEHQILARPDSGLGHHRGGSGHPFEGPGGPGPVKGQKNQLQPQPGPAVITSHPGIVAPGAGVREGSRAAAARTLPPGGARAPVLGARPHPR
jgi:hypothetical protein